MAAAADGKPKEDAAPAGTWNDTATETGMEDFADPASSASTPAMERAEPEGSADNELAANTTTNPAMERTEAEQSADNELAANAPGAPASLDVPPMQDMPETYGGSTPDVGATQQVVPNSQYRQVPALLPNANIVEAADAVPLPENPTPMSPFSEWDLAQVETPMFMTEAINDFAERPVYLTGNWSVKPHLTIGTFYDGNIFVRKDNTASDFITRVAPGVTMRLGNTDSMFYLVADYTAGLNWYMEHSNQTNLDQNATASFQWSLPKTTIGVHLGMSSDTGTDIDASNMVRQHLYFAGLTTHYVYGDKTSFDLNGDYTRSDFDGYISSSQFDASAFFNYTYSPKTQIGLGGAAGYVIVPSTGDQVYEEADVRATYRATGKLTFIGEVGGQFRQYSGGGSSSVTPVFTISGAWDVRPGTQINIGLQRQMYVSAFLYGQDYTATSVDISLVQRITDYVSASLTLGYINSDYSASVSNVSASREDNYFDIRPAVQWNATSWLSVGIFYEYSQNLSHGQGADPFQRDRGGVDFAILF